MSRLQSYSKSREYFIPDCNEINGAGTVHKTVITDLHEAFGQHMLEETPDKLHSIQRHHSLAVAFLLFVAKKDPVIFGLDHPVVGYGDPEDIGGQIFH